jgi:ATP-dependent Clp protease adaptor protein ClpS
MAETKTRDEVDIDTEFDFISPGMYKVIIQNDDHTPMDFVIAVMMHIFKHSEERARELTMQIHEQGSAVAGVYTYEVAEQKGVESTMLARQNGWPLAVRVEEE